jgi:SHS2 domain-containing protein
MAHHGYEDVDHTADVALRVRGKDFYTLLEQSAQGLYDLMGVELVPDSHEDEEFAISHGTQEMVLVDFLGELLYLAEEREQAFESFSFSEKKDRVLIRATGRKILSRARYVKAVTFHDLNIQKTDFGIEATITFDV